MQILGSQKSVSESLASYNREQRKTVVNKISKAEKTETQMNKVEEDKVKGLIYGLPGLS